MAKTWTVEEIQNDYDFRHAFYEAQHGCCIPSAWCSETIAPCVIDDIEEVIAAVEGERDESDWVVLGKLKDGRYFKMFAGCDYTGWDCRAGGNIEYHESRESLLSNAALMKEEIERLKIGHLVS